MEFPDWTLVSGFLSISDTGWSRHPRHQPQEKPLPAPVLHKLPTVVSAVRDTLRTAGVKQVGQLILVCGFDWIFSVICLHSGH